MLEQSDITRVFEALAHPYRLQLFVALQESDLSTDDGISPMDFLGSREADEVIMTEQGAVHNHLPKLEDMGFINWDRETGKISKGPDWVKTVPVLELMRDPSENQPDD